MKTAQELKETGQLLGPKERVGAEFESLVRHCKARAAELSKSIEKGTPEIQLGKSSPITMSRYSSLTLEIIDDQMELAHVLAEVELHEMERQAAKSRRQAEAKIAESRREAEVKAVERRWQAEADEDKAAERRRQADADEVERRRQGEADEAERQRQLDAEEMERQNALVRARDKVKLFKKQAEIQAKLRKQQSMGSQYSVRSS